MIKSYKINSFNNKSVDLINQSKQKAMIRRGLRISDDSDGQQPYEKVSLDANRNKSNFQKDMDNFLFGGMAPPPRRRAQQQQIVTQQQKSIERKQQIVVTKQVQVVTQRSSVSVSRHRQFSTEQGQRTSQYQYQYKSQSSSQHNSRVTSQQNSRVLVQPKQQLQLEYNKLNESKASKLSHQKSTITSNSKQQNTVALTQDKNMGDRVPSQVFTENFNSRPNYIRKLKVTSDEYNFQEQNTTMHTFIDVVRPHECIRSKVISRDAVDFRDKQFPANSLALGSKLQKYSETVEWKHPDSFSNQVTFGIYIDPNDIKRGTFSSSKFLSSLSLIAEKQQNVKRLIEEQSYNQNGFYYVRLFINSVWRYVVVDAYLPFQGDTNCGAVSYRDIESDLWVSLVEKAYAKIFNGYDVFTRPQPRQYYLRDLTGAPTSNVMTDNPQLFNIIKKALDSKKIVSAVPKSQLSNLGLNPNFSLPVLHLNKKGGLTLRYCWPLIKDRPQLPISKQGVFDLSESQLHEYISYITISHTDRSFHTTTIQTRHQRQFYSCFKLIIKQHTHGFMTISQLDQRIFPIEGYQYEPARMFIQKKTSQGKYDYVIGGFSHMSRNLDIQVDLQPGEYQIFAYVMWRNHVYDFNLTFYGDKKIDFQKVDTLKNHNIISMGLQSYNLKYGKRSALGHCHQYVIYHQQTNQIITTIVNTSPKPYKYTQDYKKINFQTLHLVNLKNNQHNCLVGLNREQLQDHKTDSIVNRKWDIDLAPLETFTWVISTSQAYDPNHFRNWGFR